jgi:hypothetical protein
MNDDFKKQQRRWAIRDWTLIALSLLAPIGVLAFIYFCLGG